MEPIVTQHHSQKSELELLSLTKLKTSLTVQVEVLLLTNDVENREKAKAEGLLAQSVREYARGRAGDVPELAEVVAAAVGGGEEDADSAGESIRTRESLQVLSHESWVVSLGPGLCLGGEVFLV